ncbi:MAG TPA: zf-HC2 domain-containing protein [Thermoanaerobaculia bacterium]|nr:zf-HC2 domain-containing protein [Thermoanaerobaculia bacterium]
MAAYIDGMLGPEEADRVTAHLATCEDCYAIYSGAVRFQLESDPGNVVQFRRPRAFDPRKWYPIAALLLVGIGAGSYQLFAPLPALVTAEVTKPIPRQQTLADEFWLGETFRGSGDDEAAPVEEAPFRMGVQLVNLQVALKADKADQAQDVIARIIGLLKDQLFAKDLANAYAGITGALGDSAKAPHDFLPEASRLAEQTREVFLADEDPSLDLGQWVEAGRLAAIAEEPSFFQESENRSFLRRFLWKEKLGIGDTKLDPAARESLRQIAAAASKDDLAAADFKSLRGQLDRILEIYYPET